MRLPAGARSPPGSPKSEVPSSPRSAAGGNDGNAAEDPEPAQGRFQRRMADLEHLRSQAPNRRGVGGRPTLMESATKKLLAKKVQEKQLKGSHRQAQGSKTRGTAEGFAASSSSGQASSSSEPVAVITPTDEVGDGVKDEPGVGEEAEVHKSGELEKRKEVAGSLLSSKEQRSDLESPVGHKTRL